MGKQDYYATLGVDRSAGADAIKSAYRKLAKQYHPDRNPDDAAAEQKFKEATEAYEVLKDPKKRDMYDQLGHAAFDQMGGGGPGGGFQGDPSTVFSDIFEDLFGGFSGTRSSRQRGRGADLRYNMEISLEEAFEGRKATIRVPTSVSCETCSGTGAEPGTSPVSCPTCAGSGRVRAQQGFFTIERTCPSCQGQGKIIKDPCRTCNGTGRTEKQRSLSVNIPQGVEDGTRIRLAGEGDAGPNGGPNGDLYIFITISPHTLFQRDANDLACEVPISFTTAVLGGQIEVPTLGGGKARVTVPEGTQSGRQFRLRGKGMPALRGVTFGDLYVRMNVETPVNLSRKQKDLLKEFETLSSDKNSPQSAGFFARVKEFLSGT
ncbi:MAG: molecular chaperone DnaJ [Pseudomonadota bacterium]